MSTTNSNITVGQNFANRFKIIKCLGVGGMGEVYLATDQLLSNSQIALKFLNQELSKDQKQVDRFLREVLLTRKVSHMNVVKTFDASILDNQLYFVMEYVDGDSLKDVIQDKKIPVLDGINYLKQIAQGLEAIHQAEIIHRDLKPANIMLQTNGQIKIADFGIARPDSSELTSHDEVIGSSHFMSPEAWKGNNITYKTDIYSLGIIAFQIFTGQLPYDGGTSAQIMFKHLEGNVPSARELNPEISAWLNNLILDLLSANPELRPELSQVIAILESDGVRKRAATKTNLTVPENIVDPTGYVSESIGRPEELSSIWDPNSNIVSNKNKTLANPNFGKKNLEERTIKGQLKKILGRLTAKKSNSKTSVNSGSHWIQFMLFLGISGVLWVFAFPIIEPILSSFLGVTNNPTSSSIRLLLNSLVVSALVAWPILIIDTLFNSITEALKKHLKLMAISFCLVIALTAFYAFRFNSLVDGDKIITIKSLLYALQQAHPKVLINLLETGLLLPVASYFEVFKTATLPAFRELQISTTLAIIPFYSCLLIYITAFAYLVRDSFREVYQQFKNLFLLPCLWLLIYGLEILIYLYLQSINSKLITRVEFDYGLIIFNLSEYQIYCSILNWLSLILLLKFILPLLRINKTF